MGLSINRINLNGAPAHHPTGQFPLTSRDGFNPFSLRNFLRSRSKAIKSQQQREQDESSKTFLIKKARKFLLSPSLLFLPRQNGALIVELRRRRVCNQELCLLIPSNPILLAAAAVAAKTLNPTRFLGKNMQIHHQHKTAEISSFSRKLVGMEH
jgi:hypothetical protein